MQKLEARFLELSPSSLKSLAHVLEARSTQLESLSASVSQLPSQPLLSPSTHNSSYYHGILLNIFTQLYFFYILKLCCFLAHNQELKGALEENVEVAQLCPTLCDPMDYAARGILQARTLERVAYPSLSPADLPNPGIKPGSPALQVDSLPTELSGKPIWRRMDTCVCTAESLHCSPEATTALLIGYSPIQNKKSLK